MDSERCLFQKAEEELALLVESEKVLLKLLNAVNGEMFDNDDVKVVHNRLTEIVRRKSGLEKELKRKKDIYRNRVQKLEHQVLEREKRLKAMGKEVFGMFPDLLKHFSQKQYRMREAVKKIRKEVLFD